MTLHSMSAAERSLALEVLASAWPRVNGTQSILAAVAAAANELPERYPEVSPDYARHLASAAVWYLDRAVRRVVDPDLDGRSEAQRAANLTWHVASADAPAVERLFAMAAALNVDDA